MELALNEVKVQAKKLLKAIKRDPILQQHMAPQLKRLEIKDGDDLQLKHCLTMLSQQIGFASWHHAQKVLSGNEDLHSTPDMGKVFYTKACGGLINLWFAQYQQAKTVLSENPSSRWLIPYQKQFIIVDKDYLNLLKVSKGCEGYWQDINHDLYGGTIAKLGIN
ncbi:hypothetical protein ORJ04_20295 [Rheinheimera baltica]|uniref:Uncharacterized protein n=1 Tax=Rheinheimera baltica TaxID=67576 RepID=A0ABT9I4H4_9GAMM|nr:hypothetical protein [Rheinheimera baltica]MDP5138292.1 hypothetical protein [Rheinheimera baltica]